MKKKEFTITVSVRDEDNPADDVSMASITELNLEGERAKFESLLDALHDSIQTATAELLGCFGR